MWSRLATTPEQPEAAESEPELEPESDNSDADDDDQNDGGDDGDGNQAVAEVQAEEAGAESPDSNSSYEAWAASLTPRERAQIFNTTPPASDDELLLDVAVEAQTRRPIPQIFRNNAVPQTTALVQVVPTRFPVTRMHVGLGDDNDVYLSPYGQKFHVSPDCAGLRNALRVDRMSYEDMLGNPEFNQRDFCQLCQREIEDLLRRRAQHRIQNEAQIRQSDQDPSARGSNEPEPL